MENNNIEEVKPEKGTNYFKVMLIFSAVMAVLLLGLNYLFKYLF